MPSLPSSSVSATLWCAALILHVISISNNKMSVLVIYNLLHGLHKVRQVRAFSSLAIGKS